MKKLAILFGMLSLMFGLSAEGQADLFNVTDGGWSIEVDTERHIREGEGTVTDGLVNWKDPFGYDYVYQDTWFGRDDTSSSEGPLSDLTFLSASNPAPNSIYLNFTDGTLLLDLEYELIGLGNSSIIVERATMTNNGASALTLSIFKYVDFDLCYNYDDHNNDYAFGSSFGITQYDDFAVAMVTPVLFAADAFQISRCGYPGSVISSLNDGAITNLDNSGSPFGPEDADFAFQWNFTFEPGETYMIENTKILTIVPEPASIVLFLLGGGLLSGSRALRKRFKI